MGHSSGTTSGSALYAVHAKASTSYGLHYNEVQDKPLGSSLSCVVPVYVGLHDDRAAGIEGNQQETMMEFFAGLTTGICIAWLVFDYMRPNR